MEAQQPFRLDRSNAKMLGVCAGISEHFEIDVTLVRVAAVLAAAMTFPVVLIGYFVIAALAGSKGSRPRRYRAPVRVQRSGDRAEAMRERLRDIDARMQVIESGIVDSRNGALAREIDALR